MDITAGSQVRHDGRRETLSRKRRGGRLYALHANERRGRSGLSPLEIAMILALVIAVVIAAVAARPSHRAPSLRVGSVKVAPGDTLWSIASANPVDGLSTEETVELIRTENGLTGHAIAAGSTLRIPVESRPEVALAQ